MDAKKYDSKIYCCSNSARTEAKLLGIVDVILHIIYLLLAIWLSDIVKNHTEYFKTLAATTNSSLSDYQKLFDQIEQNQDFYLTMIVLYSILGMMMGVLFFHAARTRRQFLLKIWFIGTIVILTCGIYIAVLVLREISHQVPPVAIVLMCYLFTLYELWIAVCLVRELRKGTQISVVSGSHLNEENAEPPSVIVLSPTPSPTPVYSIQGSGRDKFKDKVEPEASISVE